MKHWVKKLAIVALGIFPVAAVAAPWCLVRDAVERCEFFTAEACYIGANTGGGYCKPNPRELGVAGIAPYCLITEGQRLCTYRSKAGCLNKAVQVSGGCVRNTERDLAQRARGAEKAGDCTLDGTCSAADLGLDTLGAPGPGGGG